MGKPTTLVGKKSGRLGAVIADINRLVK